MKCPGGGDLIEFRRANPHLAPHQSHVGARVNNTLGRVGVVGHTTDRCIRVELKWKIQPSDNPNPSTQHQLEGRGYTISLPTDTSLFGY